MNPSNSRRTLMKGMAAAAAGAIVPVLAPGTVAGISAATRSPLSKAPTHCEQGEVVCSDGATVVETSSGRIRGFKRNGVYTFRGVPYGASTSGSRGLCLLRPLPRGPESEML
jgi:para-nitrobenzyl esterase